MNERFERVDVLRGGAIVFVVLHHFFLAFSGLGVPAELVPALGAWNRVFFLPAELGYLGVQLFFVVSGFCIHNSYLGWRRRTAEPTLASFWITYINRRFWRIYPPYALALLLAFLIAYWPHFDARAFRHLAFSLSLSHTLSEPFFYNINPAFWSVAVEWQLYLAYPVVLLLRRHFGPWKATAVAAGTAAFWHFILPELTTNWALLHLPMRWWFEWCLGFLVADLLARGQLALPRPRLATALLVPAALLVLLDGQHRFLIWLLPPLAFTALLQLACSGAQSLTRPERLLVTIGISSYSLYLIHNPLLWVARSTLGPYLSEMSPWAFWILLFALIFLVMQFASSLMFRYAELPSIALGKQVERTALPRLLAPEQRAPSSL